MTITALIVLTIVEVMDQMDQPEADAIEEIHSDILGESRKILIHFPRNYDPAKKYPTLYVLDGSSQDFRMAALAEILNVAEVVPEMIVVGIPNTDRNRDLTPHYILKDTDGNVYGQGDRFLSFVEQEVIPLIESKYPTNGYRMFAGHSRAGLFAFYTYLEKPQVFDAYFCLSPAFWRDDSIIIDKTKALMTDNRDLSKFIFMSLGTEENDKMRSAYNEMTLLLDANTLLKYFLHRYMPKANHGNNLYYSTPIALKLWSEQLEE